MPFIQTIFEIFSNFSSKIWAQIEHIHLKGIPGAQPQKLANLLKPSLELNGNQQRFENFHELRENFLN